jgi:hypothetical protein
MVSRIQADREKESMSTCTRCGAIFGCAMADGGDGPCWCTTLPAVVPVPAPVPSDKNGAAPGCWCPACLRQHIAQQDAVSSGTPR